ncbi:MAG: hypothetical protein Q7S11_04940 [bacterium]|nr:hypothetical protein [bacterium]
MKMLSFLRRKTRVIEPPEILDEERKFDRYLGDYGYNFTNSVAVAVDFFFRARLGKLPEAQQDLVRINPQWSSVLCERIVPDSISTETSCRSRIVYIGQRDNYDILFRVVVLQGQGSDKWRVVGFHYPRDEKGSYYAVFEPHHYWFNWRTKSNYLSPLVNPDY